MMVIKFAFAGEFTSRRRRVDWIAWVDTNMLWRKFHRKSLKHTYKEAITKSAITKLRDFDGANQCFKMAASPLSVYRRPNDCDNDCIFKVCHKKNSRVMLGVNCSVYGCGSCRRTKGIGIFKVP